MDLLPAAGYTFLSLKLVQKLFMLHILLQLSLHQAQCSCIRVHKNLTRITIHRNQLAIMLRSYGYTGANNSGNSHGPCQNRRMRINATACSYKALYLGLIQLYGFARY